MANKADYLCLVRMDVDPDSEDVFNDLYDEEHIPVLLKVPGVLRATRYVVSDEGAPHFLAGPDTPKYLTLYEVESPDVPGGEAFTTASDSGEFPTKVRPHLKNGSLIIYRRIGPSE